MVIAVVVRGVTTVVPHDDEIVEAGDNTDKGEEDSDSDDTPLLPLLPLERGTNGAAWTFHERDILLCLFGHRLPTVSTRVKDGLFYWYSRRWYDVLFTQSQSVVPWWDRYTNTSRAGRFDLVL